MITQLPQDLVAYFTPERVTALVKVAVVLLIGLLLARFGSRALARVLQRTWQVDQSALVRRVSFYVAALLVVAWALQELGFKLGVLLGAAGVASVAIGFASQTYLSNLISGFLLLGERPFKVGDVIEVEGETGEVLAIDMISTKLRTFANHYVRIPNEAMIKARVTNLTRFPIRRLDLVIPVAYGESFEHVRDVLREVAAANALCLEEPAPLFVIREFGESHAKVRFSVWCETRSWIAFQEALTIEIQRAFAERGVKFPYPHHVIVGDRPVD